MVLSDVLLTGIIAAIVAIITSVITSFISYRSVKTEILSKHRQDLIEKQFAASEKMWEVLALASKAKSDKFVINYKDEKVHVNLGAAKKLHEDITDAFNSKHGLYLSRELRAAIFDLRNFIETEFLAPKVETSISNNKARSFYGRVANLRNALRKEIGVEDLIVSKEGPVEES